MNPNVKHIKFGTNIFAVCMATLLLSGCFMTAMSVANSTAGRLETVTGATSELASNEEDLALRNFATKADKAGIYVYRNEEPGKARPLLIDGKTIGTTYPKTYVFFEVSPGKHVVEMNSPGAHDKVEVEADAGKLYFIWQQAELLRPVYLVKFSLHRASDEDGRKGVLETHLAKMGTNQGVD